MVWMSLRRAVTELRTMLHQTDDAAHSMRVNSDTIANAKTTAPATKPTPQVKTPTPYDTKTLPAKNASPTLDKPDSVSPPVVPTQSVPPPPPPAPPAPAPSAVDSAPKVSAAPEIKIEPTGTKAQAVSSETELFSPQDLEAAAAALEQPELPTRAADFSDLPTLTYEQALALGLFNSNLPGQE